MSAKNRNQSTEAGGQRPEISRRRGSRLLVRFRACSLQPTASSLRHPRRGVLLLVVLSLLVLFLMVGTAFIVAAKLSEKASKSSAKAESNAARDAASGALLDDVLHQIVRDTDNPHSALRGHSLLADLNGNDGFKATITMVQWAKPMSYPPADASGAPTGPAASLPWSGGVTAGQMVQFEVSAATDLYGQSFQLSGLDGAYNGQLVTFTSAGNPATGNAASAKNVSTRIVDSRMTGVNEWQITVLAFPLADGSLITNPGQLTGSQIVVNGRPFNGTGVGYDPTLIARAPGAPPKAKLTASETVPGYAGSAPIALLPNFVFFSPGNLQLSDTSVSPSIYFSDAAAFPNVTDFAGRGGADETYDAPDFQNMFLAAMQDEPRDALIPQPVAIPNSLGTLVLPSFHRPELINYWNAQLQTAGATPLTLNALMLRKVLLRPNHLDHPHFTGSNSQFEISLLAMYPGGATTPTNDATAVLNMLISYIAGPWDVDNDNDGVRDSVWIDAGLPVIMGPHGKLVKPLVAPLIIDMDGRLNVNAHGSADLAGADDEVDDDVPLAGGVESDDAPRGSGWGPADISLEAAIGEDSFESLVEGGNNAVGRESRDGDPGRGDTYDRMPQVNQSGFPELGQQVLRSAFAMPPDLRVRYGTGVNAFGQVVIEGTLPSEFGPDGLLAGDSPYEAALYSEGVDSDNGPQALDAPFSLAELEKVLRMFDTDFSALPSRLWQVTDGIDSKERNRITTDGWDLPAPNVAMPQEMAPLLSPLTGNNSVSNKPYQRRLPRSAAELVEMRVRNALWPGDPDRRFPEPLTGDPSVATTDAGRLRIAMRQILAPELAAGVRLNVNRPLGNGRDDNNNGVVDEPGEDLAIADPPSQPFGNVRGAWTPAMGAAESLVDTGYDLAKFRPLDVTFMNDPQPGVVDNADAMLQRQLLARHLYVMALTMTAPANFGQATPPTKAEQDYCRGLAQWAINAVDFRDADSAMSPFEYDLNPFDGWQPDGDLRTTADHVGPDGQSNPATATTLVDDTFVWGTERPELVMTETLAWHDRRTQDLANEDDYPPTADPQSLTDPNLPDFDPDYDQLVRPRGALFVELYNPNPAMPGASADTHDIRNNSGQPLQTAGGNQAFDWGVDLRAVDKLTGNSPVWRLAIYKRTPPGQQNPTPIRLAWRWDPDDRNANPNAAPYFRPPFAMDRSVYFTPFDPASRVADPDKWDDDGVAFFADPNNLDANGRSLNVGTVRPGRYLVVGGGRDLKLDAGNTNPVYSSPIGDLANGGQPLNGSQVEFKPRRRIDLTPRVSANVAGVPNAVRLVDFKLDNSAIQDTAGGFGVQAPSEADMATTNLATPFQTGAAVAPASVADVAIIDYVWDLADNYDDEPGVNDGKRANRRRPLTISEPARGYIDRFINTEWIDNRGYYGNPGQAALDIPLDGPVDNGADSSDDIEAFLEARVDDNGNSIWSAQYPIPRYLDNADPALCRVGPLQDGDNEPRVSYAFIFLQRLANPTLPWNPEPGHPAYDANRPVNPYLTVDRMSSDLTVFNGRPQAPPHSPHGYEEDKLATQDGKGTNTNVTAPPTFSSLERGYHGLNDPAPATFQPSVWFEQRPSQGRTTEPTIRRNLYQGKTNDNLVFRSPPLCTLGFLGTPLQNSSGANGATRQLVPAKPLHWVTWNNRPYVSGNELMLAPTVRSSMLMREFSDLNNVDNNYSPYVPPTNQNLQSGQVVDKLTRRPYGAFAQLEGFLYEPPQGPSAPAPADGLPLRLYRLLDFVGTPSLFTGATTWLNPMTVGMGPSAPTPGPNVNAANAYDDPRTDRQAPFNNVPTYRDPGRVNLNTIFSENVYKGLFQVEEDEDVEPDGDDNSHPGPQWDDDDDSLTRSRRGYGGGNANMLALDPTMPTFFANPFRSADAGELVPLPSMVRAGVECTLMRSTSATPSGIDQTPLFAAQTFDENPAETENAYRDSLRSPYFRYEPMVRLNNLTTTRSNVFAVWLTIGFFEVEPADRADFNAKNAPLTGQAQTDLFNRVYPDGYQFGKEDGLEEGDVRRLRGFYIIDRTRPAAFIPGVDANIENTIRLHRRIE